MWPFSEVADVKSAGAAMGSKPGFCAGINGVKEKARWCASATSRVVCERVWRTRRMKMEAERESSIAAAMLRV